MKNNWIVSNIIRKECEKAACELVDISINDTIKEKFYLMYDYMSKLKLKEADIICGIHILYMLEVWKSFPDHHNTGKFGKVYCEFLGFPVFNCPEHVIKETEILVISDSGNALIHFKLDAQSEK